MSELHVASVERTKKLGRHWIIAALLLIIPLSIAIFAYWPLYYSFTAPGEIVSVRDIDVAGSVHFVYVQEGITRNRYEKYSVGLKFPGAEFARVDSSAEEDFGAMLDFEEEMRNETIHHAVNSATEIAVTSSTQESRDERLLQLIGETSEYYGDSIGLMLGIGLVEEVKQEDFSRGGQIIIAGTGTLEEDHTVGSVGAIRDKLRTAESAGADIFFVPKDKETFMYPGISNEEEAQQAVRELGLKLQVVPVSNLEEAVHYLMRLPKPFLRSVTIP